MSKATHQDYVRRIEALLKDIGTPYVAVDDAKKAVFTGAKIDSFDLLIYVPQGDHLLATVLPPSRRVPTKRQRDTLLQWRKVFGSGFSGAFIHATDEPTVQRLEGKGARQPLRMLLRPTQPSEPLNGKEPSCPTTNQEVSSASGSAP
jgi:hypothetical protein